MIPADRLHQITQRFEFLEASMAAGAAGEDFARLREARLRKLGQA